MVHLYSDMVLQFAKLSSRGQIVSSSAMDRALFKPLQPAVAQSSSILASAAAQGLRFGRISRQLDSELAWTVAGNTLKLFELSQQELLGTWTFSREGFPVSAFSNRVGC